jgi:hypothetical protein
MSYPQAIIVSAGLLASAIAYLGSAVVAQSPPNPLRTFRVAEAQIGPQTVAVSAGSGQTGHAWVVQGDRIYFCDVTPKCKAVRKD